MVLKPLIIAAAGLSAATAFLLPPEITQADADSITTLPFSLPSSIETQQISIDCPGCPLALKGRHGKFRMKEGIPNHLEMNFTVDHLPTHDRLLVNGVEIFPRPGLLLSAPQIPDFGDEHRGQNAPRPRKYLEKADAQLGFQLELHGQTHYKDSQMEFFKGSLQVIEVNNVFVDGIPQIHIPFLRSPDHAIILAEIEIAKVPASAVEPPAECNVFCRWRAIVEEQLQRMKIGHKCGKMGKMGKVGQAHGEHHHGHHHHGSSPTLELHEHSWKQLFKSFSSHILFPILIGIAAGVSVSIIGMVIGTLIVGLWRVLVRRQPFFHQRRRHHHAGHSHHRAAHKETAVAEEKSGLMAGQEAPPSYEDEEDKTTSA